VVFVLALALTTGIYAILHVFAPKDSLLYRYLCGHVVEYVETWLFLWAVLALLVKAAWLRREQAGVKADLLPEWSGEPAPVEAAGGWLDRLARAPHSLHATRAFRRLYAGLLFVENRGSAEGLDEYLRAQAEADADASESAGALVRYLTWAIPILGFLGTVLGITTAISNITPEQLTTSINSVTAGLGVAFDTTAIALAYSIAVMFLNFVLDRRDQRLLAATADLAETRLAHRFARRGRDEHQVITAMQQISRGLLKSTQELVERQIELWTRSMEALRQRLDASEREQHERMQAGLQAMLRAMMDGHERHLLGFHQQLVKETASLLPHFDALGHALRETSASLERHSQRACEQAALFGNLLEGEQQVLRLQESLSQTLQALAQAGTLDRTLHSLTAAVHLLTSRAEAPALLPPSSVARPGKAA